MTKGIELDTPLALSFARCQLSFLFSDSCLHGSLRRKESTSQKGQAQQTKHKLVSLDADHGNYRKYRCKRIPWFVHGHMSECCCSRGFFSLLTIPTPVVPDTGGALNQSLLTLPPSPASELNSPPSRPVIQSIDPRPMSDPLALLAFVTHCQHCTASVHWRGVGCRAARSWWQCSQQGL